ncbi:flagellar motor protein MotB [Variovorax boronicumulans]|uniref:flagellar motor protein MotB n=1 Tax=Variovorax boronicumulans TaxID=436515 RepID=UPI00085BAF35|nr:flagellar motor protein MotB [Variovorax boronicumulans]OEZ29686.1 cell envelope biogenesis protein OmpA [Variovorax boronicumulans]
MIGIKSSRRGGGKEEAEKPFWISFSDLMTALMVLFLVAMAVALIAVTHSELTKDADKNARDDTIKSCIADIKSLTDIPEFKGVSIRGYSIDFGTLVLFGNDKHIFESSAHDRFVRKFVPRVLELARSEKCDMWLKRVVVEGFASQTGDYLYNLNLSYLRSQRVLCVLLDSKAPDAISAADRKMVQSLFLVGGSSFNTTAGDPSQMRRVELKLEFRDLGTEKDKHVDIPLDPGVKCPNDLR